jgi:hypothetical protein
LLDSFTAVQLGRASLPCGGAGGAITMPRNTAHERLEKFARESRDPKGRKMIEDLVTNFGRKPKPDYTNELRRALAADAALTLDNRSYDYPYIKKAFEKFDLDPMNPLNWRDLLGYFAMAHFRPGTSGRRKGTKKWNNNRLFGLAYHYSVIKQETPKLTQAEICKGIRKRFPQHYKESPQILRRNLAPAMRVFDAYLARRKRS